MWTTKKQLTFPFLIAATGLHESQRSPSANSISPSHTIKQFLAVKISLLSLLRPTPTYPFTTSLQWSEPMLPATNSSTPKLLTGMPMGHAATTASTTVLLAAMPTALATGHIPTPSSRLPELPSALPSTTQLALPLGTSTSWNAKTRRHGLSRHHLLQQHINHARTRCAGTKTLTSSLPSTQVDGSKLLQERLFLELLRFWKEQASPLRRHWCVLPMCK
jgi:hypothetical protein